MTEGVADTDSGRPGTGRIRMCAVTREVMPDAALLRFVAGPDGSVVPDLKAKLPGRGVWVGLDRGRVAEAVRRNVFARALKAPVRPAADLAEQVGERLRVAALGRLGLARKAGEVVTGFAKVEGALAGSTAAALLTAADAAADGQRKMGQALRRSPGLGAELPVIRLFDSAGLSLALGVPNVIHAAVLHGPAGRSFVEAAIRLQRYEGVGGSGLDENAIGMAAGPQDV